VRFCLWQQKEGYDLGGFCPGGGFDLVPWTKSDLKWSEKQQNPFADGATTDLPAGF